MRWLAEQLARWLRRPPAPLGLRGERWAAKFLRRQGYQIVARGQRTRTGEIDLVAVEGRTLVFVEVRTRSSVDHGTALDTIGPEKQRRVTRAALGYLKRFGLLGQATRFDVVALTWPVEAREPTVEHVRDAFPAVGPQGLYS